MFKDADLINVYSDYDYTIYVPNVNKLEGDYVLKPKIDGEPYYIPVLWRDIVNANRISNRIKAREIRFEGDIEAEAYKQLRIDLVREKDTYTREQIETMILNPSDEVLEKIVTIRDVKTIETILSQLIALKNTNQFFIAEKLEMYIRARKEELSKGLRISELEITPTENIDLAVVEDIEEEVEVEEIEVAPVVTKPVVKQVAKAKAPIKKTTPAKKK